MCSIHWKEIVGSYVGATAAIARVETVDVTGDVAECEIAELNAGVVGSFDGSCVALIDICLFAVRNYS